MTRRDEERLEDIDVAIIAIESHLRRGEISDGLIFDAIRVRLIDIGEASRTSLDQWRGCVIDSPITTSIRRT
jgi:hypothetical protein